jgi:hypothetical protein
MRRVFRWLTHDVIFAYVYARWRCAARVIAGWMSIFCLASCPVVAQEMDDADETHVIAQMVLDLTLATQWPDAVKSGDGRVTLCTLSDSPVGRDLASMVRASRLTQKYRLVEKITLEHVAQCHVLFMDAEDGVTYKDVWKRVRSYPVLTIGVAKRFIMQGGMIGLLHAHDTMGMFAKKNIRFEVNMAHVSRAKLNLDPMLLELAERVIME